MSDRNARLLYGDSRGSSRVTLVKFPLHDSSSSVYAGDLLFLEAAAPIRADKMEASMTNPLFGIAHEDIEPGTEGLIEIPFGAVYEMTLNADNFLDDNTEEQRIVHPRGQTVNRGSSGGPMCGIIAETNTEPGDRARILLFGGGILGMGSPVGSIGQI